MRTAGARSGASVKGFTSLNQITGEPGQAARQPLFLGPYAGMLDHLSENLDRFDRIATRVKYMVPSFDPDAPGDARRYWRDPVWYVVNNRIGLGLRETASWTGPSASGAIPRR